MPGLAKTVSIGHYKVTWNGITLGITERAHEWDHQLGVEPINSDDHGPQTDIDDIYQGERHFVTIYMLEWITQVRAALVPFHTTHGGLAIPGELATDNAKSLVLTAVAGTTAATNGPATRTATLALLSGNVRIPWGATKRIVPITFKLYPNSNGDFWTDT